jgi:hypothetical protein
LRAFRSAVTVVPRQSAQGVPDPGNINLRFPGHSSLPGACGISHKGACSDLLRRNDYSAGEETSQRKANIMGDKSPKANHKQASQKQAKNDSATQKKQAAVAAKQGVVKKN